MQAAVELVDVRKSFGGTMAVDGLSMRVEPGEVFGFLGPNGAGKTTSIRILLDILRADSGRVSVLGASNAHKVGARIGYLPEERGLYKNMTAEGVITYLATLKGMARKPALRRARELLERYGLGASAKRRIKQLSKGMAQKVQVLSTLVHDPDLLILDEPFSGLDPVNQQVLETLLADQKAAGKTVIFSTHVMQHAERLCDRILLIARGRDLFSGTVTEARESLPARIRLRTEGDISSLGDLPGVLSVFRRGELQGVPEWEIRAERHFAIETMIAACAGKGVTIQHFTMMEPTLHDVFVRLVGQDSDRGGTSDARRIA